jgi:hypothetical protein
MFEGDHSFIPHLNDPELDAHHSPTSPPSSIGGSMKSAGADDERRKAPGSPVQPQSRVFALVYPLVVLSFLGAATYGVLAPVLPILQTEVLAAAWMARAGDI